MPHFKKETWIKICCWLILLWIGVGLTIKVFTTPPDFDSAFNATVAKNFIQGHGYATSAGKYVQFDPKITTGPLVILSAAIFIELLGNEYYVPALASFSLNIFLLILFYKLLKRWHAPLALPVITFFTLGAMIFTYGIGWTSLIGEVPATLFLFISIAIGIAFNGHKPIYRFFLIGIIFGLAITTKLIFVLALPAYVWFFTVSLKGEPLQRRLTDFLPFMIGVFILPFLWYTTIYLADHNSPQEMVHFWQSEGSGWNSFWHSSNKASFTGRNIVNNTRALSAYIGTPISSALLLISIIIATIQIFTIKGQDSFKKYALLFSRFFLIFGLTNFGWWILFSNTGWVRHLLPGMLATIMAIVLWQTYFLFRTKTAFTKHSSILFLLLIVAVLALNKSHLFVFWPYSVHFTNETVAMIKARDHLMDLRKSNNDITLITCGDWNTPELEYLLPTGNNFVDCLNLKDFSDTHERLFIRSNFFNWSNDSETERIRIACESNIIWQETPYTVSKCPPETFRDE